MGLCSSTLLSFSELQALLDKFTHVWELSNQFLSSDQRMTNHGVYECLKLWYQLLASRTSAQSGFLSVLTRNMDQWNASKCSGLTKNKKTFL